MKQTAENILRSARRSATRIGERALTIVRTRRMRLAAKICVAVVLVYGLLGFIAVPLVVYHVVSPRLATSLGRPVSIARFRFNPYRLKVDIRGLHLGDRDASAKFFDIGHLSLKASWTSIFRFAPVVGEVTVEQPSIHLVRNPDGGFNFSDLLASGPAPEKPKPASAPMRFAVSNIQLRDGEIQLDDRMLGKQHTVQKIQLGIPFVASLPADVDIYVQPLLQMVVDGSPLRLTGQSKPFQATRESEIDLRLHQLDLPLYLGYVPKKLPVQVTDGRLSCDLQVHFVNTGEAPVIKVSGEAALDKVAARDLSNAPLVELSHASVAMTDVEPLTGVAHFGRIFVGGLTPHLVLNPDGSNNLTLALAGNPAPAATNPVAQGGQPANQPAPTPTSSATPVASATPVQAPNTTAVIEPAKLPDVSVESFELASSAIDVTDNSGPAPAKATLALQADMKSLKLNAQPPAPFDLTAKLGGGGTIAVKGTLDFAGSNATTQLSIDQIDLPALQNFARSALAATIASGKLNGQATIKTDFGPGKFNVHAEPAQVSLDDFVLNAPREKESPLQCKRVSASVGQVDLGTHQATVTQVLVDGLKVNARREHDGKLSLLDLLASAKTSTEPAAKPIRNHESHRRSTARSTHGAANSRARRGKIEPRPPTELAAHSATPPAEPWKYQIDAVTIENLQANVEDRTTAQPVKLALAPLNLKLKNVSSDFSKAFPLDLDATINRTGTVKVIGTAAISPLKADVKIGTRRVGLAFADPLVSGRLNATITNAELTMDGSVGAESRRDKFLVSYRGDATIGRLKLLDKLTGDDFVRWDALSVKRIDLKIGEDKPKIHVGAIALDDFYARIILDSAGKLNFKDITSSPESAPKSLTRENPQAAAAAPQPSPAVAAPPPIPASKAEAVVTSTPEQPASQPLNADVELGQITLHGGHVNYSDNFIKPNYTADLTDVSGKIGAFGTATTAPADVLLAGQVNGSSPINISGAINPLAPTAFVDIKAKADGIELSPLTPYSTRYTGYPIVKGTLTVDVHYLLDTGKLTADNHIFIDQLTFGDKVESPDATNLPIRLAVSLLKNSRGEIDLRVPVSGSLSDPQFSIGGVIWHVILNLIMKAATSPFSLIAAAMGSSGSAAEELGYIEFAPGFATLTPESQKKLDSVAAVLQQRGGLQLGIHGRVDPEVDTSGLREAAVMHAMQAEKADGKEGVDLDAVEIKPDEYEKYLGRAYRAAKFPKPTNALGLNKSLPPEEMKKLMIANAQVSDADLPKLADARAAAVRKYMSTKIDSSRLFVVAPTLNAKGIQDKGKTSRVDLSLD